MRTEIIDPKLKLEHLEIQIGQPSYPEGASIDLDLEVEKTRWTEETSGRWWWKKTTWVPETILATKIFRVILSGEQLETVLNQWRLGIVDYESWRMLTVHKFEKNLARLKAEEE